jgi:hypothetical protein
MSFAKWAFGRRLVRRGWRHGDPVGLDYSIWPGQSCGLGSSLSDLLGRLPARPLPARRPDGAGPARGVQGRRTPGAPARERGAAPPDQPGPLPAGRPAVPRGTVPAGPPTPVGRGLRGDPVRAENPVHGSDQQVCSPGARPVMIIDHVPAVRVPPDHAASSVAAAVPA